MTGFSGTLGDIVNAAESSLSLQVPSPISAVTLTTYVPLDNSYIYSVALIPQIVAIGSALSVEKILIV